MIVFQTGGDNVPDSMDMYKFMKAFLYHVVIRKKVERHWLSKEEGEWQNYISRLISYKTLTTYTCNKLYIENHLEYPVPFGYYRLWSGKAVDEGHPPRLIKVSGYKTTKYNLIFAGGGIFNRKKYTRKEIKSEKKYTR